MPVQPFRVGFIGFGEAGSILGAELAAAGLEVFCYDILLDDPAGRARITARAGKVGIRNNLMACKSLPSRTKSARHRLSRCAAA